jgi:hypothetical protein
MLTRPFCPSRIVRRPVQVVPNSVVLQKPDIREAGIVCHRGLYSCKKEYVSFLAYFLFAPLKSGGMLNMLLDTRTSGRVLVRAGRPPIRQHRCGSSQTARTGARERWPRPSQKRQILCVGGGIFHQDCVPENSEKACQSGQCPILCIPWQRPSRPAVLCDRCGMGQCSHTQFIRVSHWEGWL